MSDENENKINQDQDENSSLLRRDSTINEGKNLVLMKKGDYTVHILVEEVKSLPQISEDQLPYPIVKLTVFNQSKRTEKTKMPCESYSYDEHFYFNKSDLTVEQLDSSKIIIEVYDSSNSKQRKDYYGIYEFDLEYIYSMKNHSLNNHWLALSNSESKDMTKIRGYLKLSISVLHDNDPRVELKSNPESTNFFAPSQIKVEYKQLSIYLIRGEEMPDRESIKSKKTNKKCNPYVQFKYFGLTIESKASKNVNDIAIWNQIINLPIQIPTVSQKIVMLIKDKDDKKNNIGSYEININDIIGPVNKYANYTYIDIYGSSRSKNDNINNLMNENAEIGSAWNGRILLKIEHKNTDTPITKNISITDDNELKLSSSVNRGVMWSVNAKLYCAYYLPPEYKKYSIKIMVQDSSIIFQQKETINNCIEWEQVNTLQFYSLSNDKEKLPDMYFYLLNSDGDPVCFQRVKCSSFHLNDQVMIIKLFPEPCFGKVKSTVNSGLLKVKIVLFNTMEEKSKVDLTKFKEGDSGNENAEEDLERFNSLGLGKKLKDLYTVVVVVYMSRYLMSQDNNGSNDPFVRMTCVNETKDTSIKNETINGIWNEKLIFNAVELDIKKKSTWPILLAQVYDYDRFVKDDLLGSSYVWLSDSPYRINSTEDVKPKWHQLYLPKSNSPQGELLLSFYIFDQQHRDMASLIKPAPETKPYSFEINILGLRDIKPLAMLPIKKAYIKFDMNSLNVSAEKDDNLPAKVTQPKDKGSNPTINSALKFDLNLPSSDIYMPQLQCEVFDYIFSGMMNPSLGLFLINTKKLINETNRQIDEDTKAIQVKLSYYMAAGLVSNSIGGLSGIDKLLPKPSGEISTSSNQNNLEDSNSNIRAQEEINKLKQESEIIVRTKNYDSQFIEKNKNISEYFVVLPQYKNYYVPGSNKHRGNKTAYLREDLSMAPSSDYYFPIGYIPKPEGKKDKNQEIEDDSGKISNITKHYRRYFKCGLEESSDLRIRSPFYTVYLRRGKDTDKKDETAIFSAISENSNKIIKSYDPKDDDKTYEEKEAIKQKKMNPKMSKMFGGLLQKQSLDGTNTILPRNLKDRGYGKFKAVIRIAEKEKMDKFQREIEKFKSKDENIMKDLKNIEKYEKLTKSILVKHEVIIRVYVLELRDLPKKDYLSASDPYIKIYFGGEKKFDEQKNHQNDLDNVKWYKYYDILSIFPGDSTLKIEVWDYNPIFKDELIGETSIDLEDRYFNNDWQLLKFKPIETRSLRHPDIAGQQGNILLWVEIFDKKDSINMTPWQILPEPISKVELRLIVWETEKMRMADIEDTSDIYVTAFVDQKKKQSTDIHFRCTTGDASFNWRMVMQLDVPSVNNKLTLQCYDKDIFSKDDFISGAEIDLTDLIKIPKDLDVPITLSKDYVDSVSQDEKIKYESLEFLTGGDDEEKNKFWVQCYYKNEKSGRILCSLEILPIWKAELSKVGKGRKEPNTSPYLPPPVGRFQWSLNPLTMLNQCVGPRFRKKLYCGLCMLCLIIYLIFLIPYMIYHLGGQIFNPFNYIKK